MLRINRHITVIVFFLGIIIFLPVSAVHSASRIDLRDGSSITAEVLSKRPDRIVVDLGFTVLAIPGDAVSEITDAETAINSSGYTKDLYRTLGSATTRSIKALTAELGPAVVTVKTPVGLGSGFIINPEGYLVTNYHVIAGENRITVTVFLPDKTTPSILNRIQYDNIRIVAMSPEWDLALLKIEGVKSPDFPTVPLGDSHKVRQGQIVFAIGNPLGLERSVSDGIVSIPNRLINGNLFIQATAQINPGNSGGPLFNLRGEVVGVNNMKVMTFGSEGLGFAIPVERVKTFLENRDVFAFDPKNPNNGFRYNSPPDP